MLVPGLGMPPFIVPPVGQASVTAVTGPIFVAPPVPNPALTDKLGPPISPPNYVPPINFQQIPNV